MGQGFAVSSGGLVGTACIITDDGDHYEMSLCIDWRNAAIVSLHPAGRCLNAASRLSSWSILVAVCGELGSADNSTWTFLCLYFCDSNNVP
jgi:hypothetical protein